MENYEIIKAYLETFPEGTTIKTVLDNIKKAEQMKAESISKIQAEMEKNVGKCYYYVDIDDNVKTTFFYTKINGTKLLENKGVVLYKADSFEVSDDTIYHLKDITFTQNDLKDNDVINSSIFDEVEKKYNELIDIGLIKSEQ